MPIAFMKNIASLLFVALLCFASCQNKETTANREQDTPAIITDTASTASRPSLFKLKEYSGQYPADVHLLDNPVLSARLKSLMGADYADFRKYWQTETPLVLEDEVLSATGCEQHNCAANEYILQIDLRNNNINVYHVGAGIKSYQEKGPITLPAGLAKEFQALQGNIPE